jgi:hypothetical protein
MTQANKKREILRMNVKDCGFGTRIDGAMMAQGIKTVKQLILYSESSLLSLTALGKKSLFIIKQFLSQCDLCLSANNTIEDTMREETRYGIKLELLPIFETSKQIVELWIKLETPYRKDTDKEMMRAKALLEHIKQRQKNGTMGRKLARYN